MDCIDLTLLVVALLVWTWEGFTFCNHITNYIMTTFFVSTSVKPILNSFC